MDTPDEKKSRAFFGYESMEALTKALKRRPIPEEVGKRGWERLQQRIREMEAATSTEEPTPEAEPERDEDEETPP